MELVHVAVVSHFLAAFHPVPQSCISNTLLRHITKSSTNYATLSSTFIIKQALSFDLRVQSYKHIAIRQTNYGKISIIMAWTLKYIM